MTSSLRWLYERYRTASKPSLVVDKHKPGEWMQIYANTPEARFVSEAAGNMDTSTTTGLVLALKQLEGGLALNRLVSVESPLEVRLGHFRQGTSKTLHIRFYLVAPGKKQGKAGTPRNQFPPSTSVQTEFVLENAGATDHDSVRFPGGFRHEDSGDLSVANVDGTRLENSHDSDGRLVSSDSTVPDFSSILEVEDFNRFIAEGRDQEDNEVARFVRQAVDEARVMIETESSIDPMDIAQAISDRLALAQGPPPVMETEAPEAQDWHTASRQVVESTLSICQKYRSQEGKLAILCPSPAGGKTHGMTQAARADRAAGKKVGYAVLAKGKLMDEAKERLTGGNEHLVQLHVIEGRHPGNCVEYDSVEQAAALGYYPGSHVCPKCDKYPSLSNPFSSLDRNATCEYYGSRLRALHEWQRADRNKNPLIWPYPLILTTHAGMAIGTAMHERGHKTFRTQPSLWQFDTIFIDEDPTGALEQVFEIKEEQLVYEWRDPTTRRPDAHTQMTRVLRGIFTLARAERHVAWSSGFRDAIHTRDYGSTYAGNDLLALLKNSAKQLGYDLEEVLAQTITESQIKKPKRGELMNVKAEVAAKRYPHHHLVSICEAVRHEILTRQNAPERGAGLDLAYQVHADLVLRQDSDPATDGTTDGHVTLTVTTPFTAPKSNVVLGDAYASIEHYEGLFRRYRRYGDVDVVNHRVKWPRSSVLIRVPTRCTSGDFHTDASFAEHCDKALLPVLGLEQGRRVLLYTHKGSRDLLDEWLRGKANELGLEEYAIEHWGSGRGKDVYRDFDTFIAATEYVPNLYGLVHEANGRVAQANALTPRIYFWNAGQKRASGTNLTEAITDGNPALANAFQRRAIDELAQAVHRIRPAKPRPCAACGKLLIDDPRACRSCGAAQPMARWQKRCWVLGYHVPMSMELIAATCTVTLDEETRELTRDGVDHFGRGARVKVHADLGLMSFVSDREIASAMGEVFNGVGCWSPYFAHVLKGVPLSDVLSRVLHRVSFGSEVDEARQPFRESSKGSASFPPFSSFESNRLVDRVYSPPGAWRADSDLLVRLPMYRAGRDLFLEALSKSSRPPTQRYIRRDWMDKGSKGALCIGDPRRLEAIIDYYSPNPPPLPF